MMQKKSLGLIILCLAAVMFCFSGFLCLAQSDRGSITGLLSDPTGNIVPGAPVTATNEATGVQSRTVTTGDGYYTISSLAAGSYCSPTGYCQELSY